jgi:cell division protein FtsL
MSVYVIAPTGADIIHFGKGHDDNPPGRGSGRYAWGSGKEPKQGLVRSTEKKSSTEKESKSGMSTKKKVIIGAAAVTAAVAVVGAVYVNEKNLQSQRDTAMRWIDATMNALESEREKSKNFDSFSRTAARRGSSGKRAYAEEIYKRMHEDAASKINEQYDKLEKLNSKGLKGLKSKVTGKSYKYIRY